MDLTGILIFAFIAAFFELLFIYSSSPKNLEIKFIGANSIAIIYGSYFFLPFTTKVKKYKDLKRAYIQERIEKNKSNTYKVYDLVLEFQKKSLVLFKNKNKDNTLLEYCDKINKSISSFENCFISEHTSISKTKALLLLLIFTPLACFIPPKRSEKSYLEDVTQHFYILLAATGILLFFIILSLIVNLFLKIKNNKNTTLTVEYNIKENIDSEAKRINNSIIK
ncbi:MAG: hypothetical protein IKN42_06395 [Elusimicrobia bacterium]|nr:hypothetical protein [Elusimicrobiota bacterium]